MAQRKHLFVGGSLVAALLVASLFALQGSAQTVNCTYSASPEPVVMNVTAGQTATSNFRVTATGTDCATDTVHVQLWDTPAQATWPLWCTPTTTPVGLNSGSGIDMVFTCTPPTNGYLTYDPLIRILRGASVVQTVIFDLNISPAPVTPATSVSLSLNPTSVTRVNNASPSVELSYTTSPGSSVASNLTIEISPPSTAWTVFTTLTNVSSGTYSIPTSGYTVSGTYGVRACLNSGTCSNTTAGNMVTFTLEGGTSSGSNGTTCSSGQTWCPAAGSSPAGCYATCPSSIPATACANGERCPSNSWCTNGSQCFYPSGELTCVAWPAATGTATAGPMMVECPAGTSECNPTDTNCVGVGQTVPYSSNKWCRNGSQYYSADGTTMTCVKWGTPSPAGYSSCRPGETSCIPTGGYGPSSGWCSGSSTSCYQTASDSNANNDRYCALMETGTSGSNATCPSGYSFCSPTDTNCKQKGDSWTDSNASYWCSNAQKCTLGSGGGTCVGWNEACPAGTKYCSGSDANCVEPGEKRIRTGSSTSNIYYWCGGGGMDFHSATEVYCPPKSTQPMGMWTTADIKAILDQLGSGWGLCEPGDTQCIEPGKTGPSSGWCAWMPMGSGYMPPATPSVNTTRTCPALDAGTTTPQPPEEPKPEPPQTCAAGQIVCPSLIGPAAGTYCFTGTACPARPVCPVVAEPVCTGEFKTVVETGANGCVSKKCVKEGEIPPVLPPTCPLMPVMDFCPPGQVRKTKTTPDGCSFTVCESEGRRGPPKNELKQYFRMLADQLRGHRFFLKDLERQLNDVEAENDDVVKAKALIESGKTLAVEIDKLIKSGKEDGIPSIHEKLGALQKDIVDELQFLNASFEVYRQCGYLRQDVNRMQDELDAGRYGLLSGEVAQKLDEFREQLEELETQRADACGRADEFEVADVQDALNDFRFDFEDFRNELHRNASDSYLSEVVVSMQAALASLRAQFVTKNIVDESFDEMLKKADAKMASCAASVASKDSSEAKFCVDQASRLFAALKPFAEKYELAFEIREGPGDVFARVFEEKLSNKINAILGEKMAQLQIILDEKFQAVAAQLAELAETVKLKTEEVTQAAANVVNIQGEFKKQIEDSREAILAQIKEANMKKAKRAVKEALTQAFACAARTNWIGGSGETVRAKIAASTALLDTGTLTIEDAQATLLFCENAARDNQLKSFEARLTAFRDVATEVWYHGPANFANNQGFILGRRDTAGRLTNEFIPNQPTLWGEAVAMTVRLCKVPVGTESRLTAPVSAAASWMYPFVNGASSFGVDLARRDMLAPITRLEAAGLAVQVCKDYVVMPSAPVIAPTTYRDYAEFRSDAFGSRAVDVLTQSGVFQGNAAGEFNPANNLLRTEMAAVLQRFTENVMEDR